MGDNWPSASSSARYVPIQDRPIVESWVELAGFVSLITTLGATSRHSIAGTAESLVRISMSRLVVKWL
jgi:hypothetical protein